MINKYTKETYEQLMIRLRKIEKLLKETRDPKRFSHLLSEGESWVIVRPPQEK